MCICKRGIDIAGTAFGYNIRNFNVICLFKSVNDIKHAVAYAGTEVDFDAAVFILRIFECGKMTLRKINNMYVIAHSCSVVSVVIIAENGELFASAYCNL